MAEAELPLSEEYIIPYTVLRDWRNKGMRASAKYSEAFIVALSWKIQYDAR